MRDQVLDTRDLQKRLSELEDYETAFKEAVEAHEEAVVALAEHKETVRPKKKKDADEWDEKHQELEDEVEDAKDSVDSAANDMEEVELKELRDMADEISEWRHGETLIREDYFKQYAQELADDLGAIDRNATWPINCIDWDQAAEELKSDYSTVEYNGDTYYYRG